MLICVYQFLPGIKLGVLVIDSCDSPHHALEQAMDIIKVTNSIKLLTQSII